MDEIVYDIIMVSKSREPGNDWRYGLAAKCSSGGAVSSIRANTTKQEVVTLIRSELEGGGERKYGRRVSISPLRRDDGIVVYPADKTMGEQRGRISDDELAELVELAGFAAPQ